MNPSAGERIRDYLRDHETITQPEARRIWPEIPRSTLEHAFRMEADSGVIRPLSTRPRQFAISVRLAA